MQFSEPPPGPALAPVLSPTRWSNQTPTLSSRPLKLVTREDVAVPGGGEDTPRRGMTRAPAGHTLFNGLRVRMGISSGVLLLDAQTQGSDILVLAKEVSDAASGGQV